MTLAGRVHLLPSMSPFDPPVRARPPLDRNPKEDLFMLAERASQPIIRPFSVTFSDLQMCSVTTLMLLSLSGSFSALSSTDLRANRHFSPPPFFLSSTPYPSLNLFFPPLSDDDANTHVVVRRCRISWYCFIVTV